MRINPQTVVDVVDLSDRVIGSSYRADVVSSGLNFRTAHCLVFNEEGFILLQRLNDPLHRHRGLLGSSAATYVHQGEAYADAVVRALRDELSVVDPVPAMLFVCPMQESKSTKFIGLFRVCYGGKIVPDSEHVSETVWMSLDDIREKVVVTPDEFTPTFRLLFSCFSTIEHVIKL